MAKKNSSTIIAVAVVLTMSCCCCSSLVMFKGKYKEDNAKKEIDIEIAEDESILIPNNDKGTEFILKRKE